MRLLNFISIIGCAGLVQCKSNSKADELEGYTVNNELGKAYKIMYHGRTWNDAKLACIDEDGKLAVPKTEKEFKFLQQLLRQMKYADISGGTYSLVLWLGINNIDDYTTWVNEDGENIKDTKFHKWAGNNGDTFSDNPSEPHCAGIDASNPGFRDFWCHHSLAYICEKTL